jgi:hypothetical protein
VGQARWIVVGSALAVLLLLTTNRAIWTLSVLCGSVLGLVLAVQRIDPDRWRNLFAAAHDARTAVSEHQRLVETAAAVQTTITAQAEAHRHGRYEESFLECGLVVEAGTETKAQMRRDAVGLVLGPNESSPDVAAAIATDLYVRKAVLPLAQRHIHGRTMRAVHLGYAKEFIRAAPGHGAELDAFIEHVERPEIEADPKLERSLEQIDWVDRQSWFLPWLLRDLRRAGNALDTGMTPRQFQRETRRYVTWIADLASKRKHVKATLRFPGRVFRVEVRFVNVAMSFRTEQHELFELFRDPHLDAVYLMAWGSECARAQYLFEQLHAVPYVESPHSDTWCRRYQLRGDCWSRLGLASDPVWRVIARFELKHAYRAPKEVLAFSSFDSRARRR